MLTDRLRVATAGAIKTAFDEQTSEPRFRVFINGCLDYRACVHVAKEWNHHPGPPHIRLRDIVGDNAVLALNALGSWNEDFSKIFRHHYKELQGALGCNSFTIHDLYTFISTSRGFTPFGAHIDFEDSGIFDLEGAGRKITVWPEGEEYGAMRKNAEAFYGISFEWKQYMDAAHSWNLSPTQYAVIPRLVPHLFEALGAGYFFGVSFRPQAHEVSSNLQNHRDQPGLTPSNDPDFKETAVQLALSNSLKWLPIALNNLEGEFLNNGTIRVRLTKEELTLMDTKTSPIQKNKEPIRSLVTKLVKLGLLFELK